MEDSTREALGRKVSNIFGMSAMKVSIHQYLKKETYDPLKLSASMLAFIAFHIASGKLIIVQREEANVSNFETSPESKTL